MLIHLNHLTQILAYRNLLSAPLQAQLQQYALHQSATVDPAFFSSLKLQDWKALSAKQTPPSHSFPHGSSVVTILLHHSDPAYPFSIGLFLNNAKGAPSVTVQIFNLYTPTSNIMFSQEVLLASRKKKASLRQELLDYWNRGAILHTLQQKTNRSDIAYKQIATAYSKSILYDVNGKKITGYKALMIAFLYEKIKLKKLHTLGDEPTQWSIPKRIQNALSSGFVDALQDCKNMHYDTQNSDSKYRSFLKYHPTLDAFAETFDVRYF